MVVEGRTYVIPAAGSAVAPAAQTPTVVAQKPADSAAASAKPQAADPAKDAAPASPEYFYTVKSGDSLTKIAVLQLGTPGAVEAIKDLNKDLLKGGETIRPNMKLRLPAKPLASAAQ
jgi:nucleoid-associated protein YgaU